MHRITLGLIMNNKVSDKVEPVWLFGIYQILGGILGLIILVYSLYSKEGFSGHYEIFVLITLLFYGISITAGWLLVLKSNLFIGYVLSSISLGFQIFSFGIGYVVLSFINGIGILGTLDISQEILLGMEFQFSSVDLAIVSNPETFYIKFNFIAVILFIWTMNKFKEAKEPITT